MKKIFLIGGGTGGHLFPAISTAHELENRGFESCVITDQRCAKYVPANLPFEVIVQDIPSIACVGLKRIFALMKMAYATLYLLRIFYRSKPSAVVGFGGYPTLPALFAAKILKIPIILHEQNSFLGKANRTFSRYAKVLALNFKDTSNLDLKSACAIVTVGNPVRYDIASKVFKKSFALDTLTILVIGGSQGASVFDDLIPEAIELLSKECSRPIRVVQQVAKNKIDALKERYNRISVDCQVQDFFQDMSEKYDLADIAICRSGASTINELIHVGLPAVLIPLPSSANDHQLYNANLLAAKGGVICLLQKNASACNLSNQLKLLLQTPGKLIQMHQNLQAIRSDGTKNLADCIIFHS